ncbi:MAG: hypothetical protein AAGK97_14850, partial [Bacteroidota bacterium]
FESKNPKRDSVIHSIPFCIINVERFDNTTKQVELFKTRQKDPNQTEVKYVDELILRYFAFVDDKDFLLVQDRVFKKLLRGYDYFVE